MQHSWNVCKESCFSSFWTNNDLMCPHLLELYKQSFIWNFNIVNFKGLQSIPDFSFSRWYYMWTLASFCISHMAFWMLNSLESVWYHSWQVYIMWDNFSVDCLLWNCTGTTWTETEMCTCYWPVRTNAWSARWITWDSPAQLAKDVLSSESRNQLSQTNINKKL
jgi:hypothetical protein